MAADEEVVISLEADPSFDDLGRAGASVEKHAVPHSVLDDMFLISGEIPRKTAYEEGIRGALRYSAASGRWEPYELIWDERFVVCHIKSKPFPFSVRGSPGLGENSRIWPLNGYFLEVPPDTQSRFARFVSLLLFLTLLYPFSWLCIY